MSGRQWTFTPVVDLTATAGIQRRRWLRTRAAIGRYAGARLGLQNRWQLGYCAPELLQAALHSGAGLFIAHSEQALWVADSLLSAGHRIGVDMEDWFSEDLLPQVRRQRPLQLLRRLEGRLLREGRHTTCPSHAMSLALAAQYDCRPPLVNYNAFAWSERAALDGQIKDRRNLQLPSLHWYSQTLGPGRGLEDLFQALWHINADTEIHLRGCLSADSQTWLATLIPSPWKDRVFIHPLVSNSELLSRIAEHDIGFAGEMKYCPSRDLTVTNKILHYLLAGLPVVASDTAGQVEVAARAPGAVRLYPSGNSQALAANMNELLGSADRLQAAKIAATQAARDTFSWEQQEAALLASIQRALAA
ncbi:MAG TPA: glycosyltransferase [Burkholderiaceae bacterium]|nr:glycosyltransferase [Burkholderiaceae bacterium]